MVVVDVNTLHSGWFSINLQQSMPEVAGLLAHCWRRKAQRCFYSGQPSGCTAAMELTFLHNPVPIRISKGL